MMFGWPHCNIMTISCWMILKSSPASNLITLSARIDAVGICLAWTARASTMTIECAIGTYLVDIAVGSRADALDQFVLIVRTGRGDEIQRWIAVTARARSRDDIAHYCRHDSIRLILSGQ